MMNNKRGEITYQSVILGLLVFALIVTGGFALFNESFVKYGIDNSTLDDPVNQNLLALNNNITKLIKEAEDEKKELTFTEQITDVATLGVSKILRKLDDLKNIWVAFRASITTSFDFVPSWIIYIFFGIISVILVMRGLYAWLKVKP